MLIDDVDVDMKEDGKQNDISTVHPARSPR